MADLVRYLGKDGAEDVIFHEHVAGIFTVGKVYAVLDRNSLIDTLKAVDDRCAPMWEEARFFELVS